MIGAHSADQVRAAERPALDAGMGAELMHRASHGLSLAIVRELRTRRGRVYGAWVTGLIGKGNNGGDGLWALAFLARRGVAVTAVLVEASAHAEGLAALLAAGGRAVRLAPGDPAQQDGSANDNPAHDDAARLPLRTLAEARDECVRADVVIDAILGTGARGGLRGAAAGLVELLLREGSEGRDLPYVVACDVPSGVDPTTGEVTGPVLRAGITITFAAAKSGLFLPPGAGCAGRVEVVPIGVEDRLPEPVVLRLEPEDVSRLLPRPAVEGHKYTRGVLGVRTGSDAYPGAAVLGVEAAWRTGLGMVRYVGPERAARL
ncbi:MAG: bifunctional ADP-dependent NAD(P)H-hydrate dehydratase/NAD(P)H-hydrate epimerase, partial [Arthrobacter sp.]|nr:bifunctional ADP-dependent NAD(P)H-hydrate dehydratase/NAD(P)H-hydrate epimerase [Arthrobacter sp.]